MKEGKKEKKRKKSAALQRKFLAKIFLDDLTIFDDTGTNSFTKSKCSLKSNVDFVTRGQWKSRTGNTVS